ncbi:MAG: hypothetical protein AABX86_02670 [Nanoarchaeota archaeon]
MKGELFSQPLVMIFALVVLALILLFGIRSFTDIKEAADDVELVNFVRILQDEVKRYYQFDVGSSKKLALFAPSQAQQLCFYDPLRAVNIPLDTFTKTTMQATNYNLYFLPLDAYQKTAFTIVHTKNNDVNNPFCIPQTNGRFLFLIATKAEAHTTYVGVQRE